MTTINPMRCISSWNSFQECGTNLGHFLVAHLKDLEKAPRGNSEIWEKYSANIADSWTAFEENPTAHNMMDFVHTVCYLKETSKDLGFASLTLVSTIAKNSLKNLADHFFELCPLPQSLSNLSHTPLDFKALTVIAGFVTLETFASSYVQNEHLEKKLDFTTMGTVVGTAMSWIFDQNLYLGATAGTITGLATGFIAPLLDPILIPTENFLSDFCEKAEIKKLLIALPPAVFLASTAYIANQSPETEWPSVFGLSLLPTLGTCYTLFYNSDASYKVAQKAYKHLLPAAWLGYTSMALLLAFQNGLDILEAKLEN